MPVFSEMLRQQLSTTALKAVGWSANAVAHASQPLAGAWALRLFSRPRARKSKVHHPDLLTTAERLYYPIAGTEREVAVFVWKADGPTVFLAHGWESNSSRWLQFIRALHSRGYQVISIDAPAHGFSNGREFNVFLYTRALKEVLSAYQPDIFIGHSAGGMAGVYHLYQEKTTAFQKLILLAVPHELEDLMDTFRQIVGMNDRVFAGLKAAFEQQFGLAMADFSVRRFVQHIRVPGLVVHDRGDDIAPYAGGVAIHQNWKGSELVSTRGLGHSLLGAEAVEAVVEYLEGG